VRHNSWPGRKPKKPWLDSRTADERRKTPS
jgi:hypothetical protein